MNCFALVLSALLVSVSSFAGEQVLCTERAPDWSPFLEGSEFAEDVGQVALFDIDANTVTFGPKTSINTLESRIGEDGRLVYGFFSSGEKEVRKITASTRSLVRTEEVSLPYELGYSFVLLGEGRRANGTATVTLSGDSLKSMGQGTGSYDYPGNTNGSFVFCTSIVQL